MVGGFVGEGHEKIDSEELGVIDGPAGDDDVGTTVATARFRAVGLCLNDVAVVPSGGHRQDNPHEDHPLAAAATEAHLYEVASGKQSGRLTHRRALSGGPPWRSSLQ